MLEIDKTLDINNELRERIAKRGKELLLNAPRQFIHVDVEADGIAGYGSMLSIGACCPTGEEFYSEIKPISDVYILKHKEFCDRIGLKRERLMVESKTMNEVMIDFTDWANDIKNRNRKSIVFSGYNAGFDWSFVNLYLNLASIKNPFYIAPFDIKSLALILSKDWDWKETNGKNLPSIVVPNLKYTHNALEDAKYAQEVHYNIAGLSRENNYFDIIKGI